MGELPPESPPQLAAVIYKSFRCMVTRPWMYPGAPSLASLQFTLGGFSKLHGFHTIREAFKAEGRRLRGRIKRTKKARRVVRQGGPFKLKGSIQVNQAIAFT